MLHCESMGDNLLFLNMRDIVTYIFFKKMLVSFTMACIYASGVHFCNPHVPKIYLGLNILYKIVYTNSSNIHWGTCLKNNLIHVFDVLPLISLFNLKTNNQLFKKTLFGLDSLLIGF